MNPWADRARAWWRDAERGAITLLQEFRHPLPKHSAAPPHALTLAGQGPGTGLGLDGPAVDGDLAERSHSTTTKLRLILVLRAGLGAGGRKHG